MSSTTMHFGPEWMRTKHHTSTRPQPAPEPPASTASPGASSYSSLVSPAPPSLPEKRDEAHPFRYPRDELLRIYKEGGGKAGLGLEVERWEGVVREVGIEPIALREMSEFEKKVRWFMRIQFDLFQGPLNSDLRRRQSADFLSPLSTQSLGTDRSRLNLAGPASATGSPLRDRFGALRRKDSTDQPTVTIPRKQSFSNSQPSLGSPREPSLASPRRGPGYATNFDGILGGGDSWVVRRRTSEASVKTGPGITRQSSGDHQGESKGTDILEEEEEDAPNRVKDESYGTSPTPSGISESVPPGSQDSGAGLANLSLNAGASHVSSSESSQLPSMDITDYTNVEWSYKDPTGQVQGPFVAEVMQKWCDDGYFTGDLPVKRTHLDTQWITVEELSRQHRGPKIFLSPPMLSSPPGLTSHRSRSPQNLNQPQEQQLSNAPFQPHSLRNPPLESYSDPSDSPASSFGGRFNESVDPGAFGGRGSYFGESSSRLQSFSGIPDPSMTFNRRNPFGDPSLDPSPATHPSPFGSLSGRGPASDAFGYGSPYTPGQNGWNLPLSNATVPVFGGTAGHNPIDHPNFSNFANGSGATKFGPSAAPQDAGFGDNTSLQPLDLNQYPNGASPAHLYPPAATFSDPQHARHGTSDLYEHTSTLQTHSTVPQVVNPSPHVPHSPWITDPPARRLGPFDAPHPTSANIVLIQPTSSPWEHVNQPSQPKTQINEWSTPSHDIVDGNWQDSSVPDSLTFSNLGQHNEQQERLAASTAAPPPVAKLSDSEKHHTIQTPQISAPPETPKAQPPPIKSKNKSSSSGQLPVAKATPSISQTTPESLLPASTPKVAWSKDDDSKAKSTTNSISLREIQEAETKKADARKVAERDRERAARTTAAQSNDAKEPPSFTTSWGLPTFQAGAGATPRINGTTPKETTQAPAAPQPTTPVWMNAVQPSTAKKSMKEIQEEEEKRKKNAAKEAAAATAARRVQTEAVQKVMPSAQGGGVWTTVGPSGKPTVPATSARVALTPSTSASGALPSTRSNGTPAARPVSASPVVTTSKLEDPVSPSHDFLKWLSSSLKGLNSSVNVEEIVSMLLSFPLDPDPSTIEIISELIYANSTTLDGRRFAAEFISKRKADAASRPKSAGNAGKASTKPISIADVVKAVPKPTQPEWGFKVVNKKKKGGRG